MFNSKVNSSNGYLKTECWSFCQHASSPTYEVDSTTSKVSSSKLINYVSLPTSKIMLLVENNCQIDNLQFTFWFQLSMLLFFRFCHKLPLPTLVTYFLRKKFWPVTLQDSTLCSYLFTSLAFSSCFHRWKWWINHSDHKTRRFGKLHNTESLCSDNQLWPQWTYWATNRKMYFLTTDLRVTHLPSYTEDLFSYHGLWPFAIAKLQNIHSWWCRL